MKNSKKSIFFLCITLFFITSTSATISININYLYKTIFHNNMYSHHNKIALIDKALSNQNIANDDRNTLTNLKMILSIFVKSNNKMTPNIILYRTPKETLMHWAAKLDQDHLVKLLIQEGALLNPRNQWEQTPLHYAAEWNSPKATQLLLENGANLNVHDQYNKTPLDYAIEHKNKIIIDMLSPKSEKTDKDFKYDSNNQ